MRDGKLYAAVVVPLLAPEPVAWICLGFRIDDAFAAELAGLTNQEISFVSQQSESKIVASTLQPAKRTELVAALEKTNRVTDQPTTIRFGKVPFVTLLERLEVRNGKAVVALQRNLNEELAPFSRRRRTR